MSKLVVKAAEKHNTWINIVKSFGCPEYLAEDIVQEMYIYLIEYEKKGTDIWYNEDEVNYYYIFKMLKGLHVGYLRSEKKVIKISLDEINLIADNEQDIIDIEEQYEGNLKSYVDAIGVIEKQFFVKKNLQDFWYVRKVFEDISKGESIASLSRKSGIGYYSLYNTYNKMKETIKSKLI